MLKYRLGGHATADEPAFDDIGQALSHVLKDDTIDDDGIISVHGWENGKPIARYKYMLRKDLLVVQIERDEATT